MKHAIDAFAKDLSPDTPALVFFAGHGVQRAGLNYLIPRDAEAQSGEALYRSSVSLPDILAPIGAKRPLQTCVVLDACRDDPLPIAIDDIDQSFSALLLPSGFYLAYSAGSGETALDDAGEDDTDQNGVFTRVLLRHMNAHESLDRIIKKTRVDVARLAAKAAHQQHPTILDQTTVERRIDGTPGAPSAASSPSLGHLPNREVLIVAFGRYAGGLLPPLHTPGQDAHALGALFRDLGCRPRILCDPSRQEFDQAFETLCTSMRGAALLYIAGHGVFDGQNELVIPAGVPANTPEEVIANAINLGAVAQRLVDAGKRALLLVDSSLVPLPSSTSSGHYAMTGGSEAQRWTRKGSAAILYATGYFQPAADVGFLISRSAFAAALSNAFAVPGLSLQALAARVRRDVEEMTGGTQTPLLVASPSDRASVVVHPL